MNFKKISSVLLCVIILFTCIAGCTQPEQTENAVVENKEQLLKEAYTYTLPLMIMDATFTKMTNTVAATNEQAPANQFIHAKALATADFKNVVTPNVDTIYSQVFYDVSNDAVIIEFPKTDRFCMVEIMDAYTNCISLIDATAFEEDSEQFILTGKNFGKPVPDGMQEIKSPTARGWIIVRTICNDPEDALNVHAIQGNMKIYTLTQYESGNTDEVSAGSYDPNNNFIPVSHVMSMSMQDYFDRANTLMEMNPPSDADAIFMEKLKQINVGPSLKFDGDMFAQNGDELWREIVSGITADVTAASMKFMTKNGNWSYMGAPIAEFGTEYAYRALIALVGLGANPVSVAVYPKVTVDSDNGRLNGKNRYILHFERDELPPVEQFGFWSVTAYKSSDNLLIDNALDRYCINDRSDVTFNDDGSLDIFIQADEPEGGTSNWLPIGEDDFHLILRIYFPDESVLKQEWQAPTIARCD